MFIDLGYLRKTCESIKLLRDYSDDVDITPCWESIAMPISVKIIWIKAIFVIVKDKIL